MKTLYEYVAPEREGGVKVRLIERMTFVPPAAERRSFAVIVNPPGEPAMFDTFHDIEYAASSFATIIDRFGGVTAPNQVAVFWP